MENGTPLWEAENVVQYLCCCRDNHFCEDTVPRQRATQESLTFCLLVFFFSVCWLFWDKGPSRVLTHQRPMTFSSYLPGFDQKLHCLSMWKWCCQDVLRLQFLSVMFTSSTLTRLGELTFFFFFRSVVILMRAIGRLDNCTQIYIFARVHLVGIAASTCA